ncbi:hypothetical protein BHE74_00040926 [Ensete ventricosum]|nr:hypothetical protein GW17_00004663 [Ensete ventricosum]RWW52648.1 hypothetical protein BHE74_00040926 [Ensete ventricosum]RZR81349.1 hypothetical protein BHM03_00007541 [Ensete ventricosum]
MLLENASLLDQSGLEHGSLMTTGGLLSNGGATEMNGWASAFHSELVLFIQYNFVGRLLGPRGNSLKRVEANTDCRILIRGRGSIKDLAKEESHDFFKQQQLRELAMINGTLRDEGAHMLGSVSPFHSSLSMKRAKT